MAYKRGILLDPAAVTGELRLRFWSQADLARITGLRQATISEVVTGRGRRVSQETAYKILAAFRENPPKPGARALIAKEDA